MARCTIATTRQRRDGEAATHDGPPGVALKQRQYQRDERGHEENQRTPRSRHHLIILTVRERRGSRQPVQELRQKGLAYATYHRLRLERVARLGRQHGEGRRPGHDQMAWPPTPYIDHTRHGRLIQVA